MTCWRHIANKWQTQNVHPTQCKPQLHSLNHHLYKSLIPSCHRIIDFRAGRQLKELFIIDTQTKKQEAQRGQWLALGHTAEEWQSQGGKVKLSFSITFWVTLISSPVTCFYGLTLSGATPSVTWTWCSESLGWGTWKGKLGLDFS